LFAARGYHATGIDDLGEAVNVTGPAIYRHFESKVEILTEVIEGWMGGVMDGVDRIGSEARPPVETLDLLIDNFVTCAIEAPAPTRSWRVSATTCQGRAPRPSTGTTDATSRRGSTSSARSTRR